MRKFLSSTAGASFNQELANQTICVRKDCVELIYKVKPSVYVVVSMVHVCDGEAMLFVNWAHYFDRLQNQQVQMPRIEECCPTLYAVMTGDDADLLSLRGRMGWMRFGTEIVSQGCGSLRYRYNTRWRFR